MLDEAIGPGEVWRRGCVFNVMSLQELDELIRYEGRTIVSVDEAGQSILGDKFLYLMGQGIGCFGGDFG